MPIPAAQPLGGLSYVLYTPKAETKHQPTASEEFRPSRSLIRAGGIIAVILLAAVVVGRAEFAMIAVPFAVGTALHLYKVPRHIPESSLELDSAGCEEGDIRTGTFTLTNEGNIPVAVHVSVPADRWVPFTHGTSYTTVVRPRNQHTRNLEFVAARWGHHSVGPVQYRTMAAGGLLETPIRVAEVATVSVRANPIRLNFDSNLRNAKGFVGTHLSRRYGDAAELAEVRHFQPGDRLRRIDWRMSARSRDLYVNATESERDADVTLILDLTDEVGDSSGFFGDSSAIDLAVRSAAGVAEEFIRQGDQVSMYEFNVQPRHLRPGAGQRQRQAMYEWLSGVKVPRNPVQVSARRYLSTVQSGRGLHVVLTPFLTTSATDLLALLTQMGRQVMCVNTLPRGIAPEGVTDWQSQAVRLWHLEREGVIGFVQERGIRVIDAVDMFSPTTELKGSAREVAA